ncbi:FAD-dependent oxidoreductase, partial [Mesorhizobium sp. M0244]|uniref:FAD-dependent oxidoreductase n=1 Tax=Mesorhizobium sp. M0244 TaxID=2956926 RepID=UPI00333C36BB
MNARRPLPQSLYAETALPAIETPPLEGDRSVSVAVVGGGYTGLSTALHLAERGIDATVLERYEPGWGASGKSWLACAFGRQAARLDHSVLYVRVPRLFED